MDLLVQVELISLLYQSQILFDLEKSRTESVLFSLIIKGLRLVGFEASHSHALSCHPSSSKCAIRTRVDVTALSIGYSAPTHARHAFLVLLSHAALP